MVEDKEIIDKIVHGLTLSMLHTGGDQKNYEIMNSLPLTASEIEIKLNLTKMPANKRIRELMVSRLIHRERRGAKIELTALGEDFLHTVKVIKEKLLKNMRGLI